MILLEAMPRSLPPTLLVNFLTCTFSTSAPTSTSNHRTLNLSCTFSTSTFSIDYYYEIPNIYSFTPQWASPLGRPMIYFYLHMHRVDRVWVMDTAESNYCGSKRGPIMYSWLNLPPLLYRIITFSGHKKTLDCFFKIIIKYQKRRFFLQGKKQQQRELFNLFFSFKNKKKNNKYIVALKKWVSGRVFLFYRQCFSASQTCIFTRLSFSFVST